MNKSGTKSGMSAFKSEFESTKQSIQALGQEAKDLAGSALQAKDLMHRAQVAADTAKEVVVAQCKDHLQASIVAVENIITQ